METVSETVSDPVYFELSWSILSTIGVANVLFGAFVVSITNFSPIAAVPIVTSIAGAVANGLCYYAFYRTSQPLTNQAVASAFADILWMVQEAGLSFYSYVLLSRILSGRPWYIFVVSFWTAMLGILTVRVLIAVTRVRYIAGGGRDNGLQNTVNHLHMAYFPLLALLECLSAYYLLTTFAEARSSSLRRASGTDLFHYLMRSTEIRMALLAVIGIMRAVTYSYQSTAQSATNVAGQIDRFAYTMECIFPIMMYIDMLSTKVVHGRSHAYDISLHSQNDPTQNRTRTRARARPRIWNRAKQGKETRIPRTRRFVTSTKHNTTTTTNNADDDAGRGGSGGSGADQIFVGAQPDHEQAIEITGGRSSSSPSPSASPSPWGRRSATGSRERIVDRHRRGGSGDDGGGGGRNGSRASLDGQGGAGGGGGLAPPSWGVGLEPAIITPRSNPDNPSPDSNRPEGGGIQRTVEFGIRFSHPRLGDESAIGGGG
ncbi:hypothetical protein MYCTH_92805 [Thermothelomyces thermophilus ATCC 42464]|uniref:Uncharacterized protein n=1 Tax=Thermothelomyces thermophilus (strain ATCC 42464 / BCRC 31852 / DSM 1799) TaxID=573729 RepID=G2Q9Q7_THET4|nr:uncharacterized protein MYCTH_92805 [Thermothelomyces thermophilus ATCC 42464]AEO56516.1 hypothetical protein MYCTH_92805 [Thermothelomyces thermophilus ATCC 42464]